MSGHVFIHLFATFSFGKKTLVAFQNVSCFVFEQSIVFHNDAIQNITMYSILKRRKCVFLKQSKSNQASDYFAYRHRFWRKSIHCRQI